MKLECTFRVDRLFYVEIEISDELAARCKDDHRPKTDRDKAREEVDKLASKENERLEENNNEVYDEVYPTELWECNLWQI